MTPDAFCAAQIGLGISAVAVLGHELVLWACGYINIKTSDVTGLLVLLGRAGSACLGTTFVMHVGRTLQSRPLLVWSCGSWAVRPFVLLILLLFIPGWCCSKQDSVVRPYQWLEINTPASSISGVCLLILCSFVMTVGLWCCIWCSSACGVSGVVLCGHAC